MCVLIPELETDGGNDIRQTILLKAVKISRKGKDLETLCSPFFLFKSLEYFRLF